MRNQAQTKHVTAKVIILSFIIGAIVAITAMNLNEIKNFISLIPIDAKIGIVGIIAVFLTAWAASPRKEKKNIHPSVDNYKRQMDVQRNRIDNPKKYGTVKQNPVNREMKAKGKELLDEVSCRN